LNEKDQHEKLINAIKYKYKLLNKENKKNKEYIENLEK